MNVLPLKLLLHVFNEEGRFPTKTEMITALDEACIESLTWVDLEANLLNFAKNNKDHPYHEEANNIV